MTPREVPLLFSTPMAAGLLARRKFETRREVKTTKRVREWLVEVGAEAVEYINLSKGGEPVQVIDPNSIPRPPAELAPIQPGNFIWPRETWRPWSWHEGQAPCIEYRSGGKRLAAKRLRPEDELAYEEWEGRLQEKVTAECEKLGLPVEDGLYVFPEGRNPLKWRSPIFLPRWCSRWRLPVVSVRAERIQEITDDGAIAEGCEEGSREPGFAQWRMAPDMDRRNTPREAFRDYWERLHGPGAWESNALVWVYRWEEILAV